MEKPDLYALLLSSRPSPWPRGHSRTQIEVLGLGLEISSEVLGLGLGLEGQVLGLGLGLDEKVLASSEKSWSRGQHYDFLNIVYLNLIQYTIGFIKKQYYKNYKRQRCSKSNIMQ